MAAPKKQIPIIINRYSVLTLPKTQSRKHHILGGAFMKESFGIFQALPTLSTLAALLWLAPFGAQAEDH